MLEISYDFFTTFCDTDKYEEIEMDTASLYLAKAEKKCLIIYEVKKGNGGNCYAAIIVMIHSTQTPPAVFFHRTCCA